MPRDRKIKKRIIASDPIYKSRVLTRFINRLMLNGSKSISKSIVYDTLGELSGDKKEAVRIFESAVKNVMPKVEVRSRRVGGATYQIPVPLKHDRSEALAIRWIIEAGRRKRGKPMSEKLRDEISAAANVQGDAIKKRDDTHKMAEANKAFAHFRF